MDNILRVAFKGKTEITARPLYQYDYGQILKFIDLDLPSFYEVHFSNYERGMATTTIGDSTGVLIPDVYLQTGLPVYVWVYLHTKTNDGETEYKIVIPVNKRAQPSNEVPSQVQQDVITQTLAALNNTQIAIAAVASQAEEAALQAEVAASHYPIIREKYWYVWDTNQNKYVNTNIISEGKPGTGLSISGTVDTVEDLPEDVEQGTIYHVGITAPYLLYMYEVGTGWLYIGQLEGVPGTTFTPSVDEEGIISWTNDGGKINPVSANIKGPPGSDGYSPTVTISKSGTISTISITDKNGTTTASIFDGQEVVNSDWNENDSENLAYIENRPFFVTGTKDNNSPFTSTVFQMSFMIGFYDNINFINMVEGDTYIITTNNKRFICTAFVLNGSYDVNLGEYGYQTLTYNNQIVIGDEAWVRTGISDGLKFISFPGYDWQFATTNDSPVWAAFQRAMNNEELIRIEHISAKQIDKDFLPVADVAFSGDYNDILNKPKINNIELKNNTTAEILGLGTYSKPSNGIPLEDLTSSVQTSLSKADTAYQLPSTGIPSSALAAGVIPVIPSAAINIPEDLGASGSVGISDTYARSDHIHRLPSALDIGAYSLPSNGIPLEDLSSSIQISLEKADTAYQLPSNGIPIEHIADNVIPVVPIASDSTPQNLGELPSAGNAITWSRSDHVHKLPTLLELGAQPAITLGGILKGDGFGEIVVASAQVDYQEPIHVGTITLTTTDWSGEGPWTHAVSTNDLVARSSKTKVDLQPDAAVFEQMVLDGIYALYITNTSGQLSAVAAGSIPTQPLTIQCTYYETI